MATKTINTLAEERILLKQELDALTERLKEHDEVLIKRLQSSDTTKVETSLGNLTLVSASTTSWNDEVLKELLTPAQWKRIIVEKVDKARLDAELLAGRINSDEVAVAKTIKPSKPYLKNS